MTPAFKLMLDAVHRYEGTVNCKDIVPRWSVYQARWET